KLLSPSPMSTSPFRSRFAFSRGRARAWLGTCCLGLLLSVGGCSASSPEDEGASGVNALSDADVAAAVARVRELLKQSGGLESGLTAIRNLGTDTDSEPAPIVYVLSSRGDIPAELVLKAAGYLLYANLETGALVDVSPDLDSKEDTQAYARLQGDE